VSHSVTDKLLIVNADDYGYTASVSAGIRLAHRQGIVSSTSVMMTMPAAVRELGRLRDETPTLGVGVHLTVTEGRPFRLPRCFHPKQLARELAAVDGAVLRAEWRAQIEALLATGVPLTHLDSHHHAAYRHAGALTVLFDLARAYDVPVRNPYPIGDAAADALAGAFADAGVRHPGHFVDVFDQPPFAPALAHTLATLPPGVTELMCHPGLVDDELRQLSSRADVRAEELAALTEAAARGGVERSGAKLISFAGM
jgi:chitin disaccharide deacetylase